MKKKKVNATITTTERPKHSPIGASSRHRWSKCPGSIRLSKGIPDSVGRAAKEGSMAHELLAFAMENAFSKNISVKQELIKIMKDVLLHGEYVESIKKDNPCHIEHSFDMSNIFEGGWGTADTVIFDKEKSILHVPDFKYGENLVVEVKNNSQLEYYALGALLTLPYPCRWVQMTIIQPRAYHPDGPIRHWKVPALHFLEVEAKLIEEVEETKKKDAALCAGSHCIFCPAKLICPEKQNMGVTIAKKEFSFYNDPKKEFDVI